MTNAKNRKGFTLIEISMVVVIVLILATVAIVVLNPVQKLAQSRDGKRVTDLKTLDGAIELALFSGDPIDNTENGKVYLSLPDTNGILDDDCRESGEYPTLPALSGGWEYRCMADGIDIRKIDGSGWLPIEFSNMTSMPSLLSILPVDPDNTINNYYAYSKGLEFGEYSLFTPIESTKYASLTIEDGGTSEDYYETSPVIFSPIVTIVAGTVKSHQKISDTQGNFAGTLDDYDWFGRPIALLGDLDGDGAEDIAVGTYTDDDGGANRGAVWILFLDTDGTVKSHQKISDTEGNFTGVLDDGDYFGRAIALLGDLDGDGVGDIAVGATSDDDSGTNRGAVWILFLDTDGTVKSHQKISDTEGNFAGVLDDSDYFGYSVSLLGDLDGDGVGDIAVGAAEDDDGGGSRGAVWILFLDTDGTVKSHQKISDTEGSFTGILDDVVYFGTDIASLGDLDGDGIGDIVVGASNDRDGGGGRGAVWVLFLDTDGTVKSYQKINDIVGNFTGTLDDWDNFGISVSSLGDLDGDGVGDIAVGAHQDDDGGISRGAVWILFLDTDGTVKSHQKISDTEGNFTGGLDNNDFFGGAVASLGDLDGNGVDDIAVNAFTDDDGGADRGAVWILFLE
ncbi:MAG: prepilin-type N-terminal cleavage/methylation domain-containing protein [bacterium]